MPIVRRKYGVDFVPQRRQTLRTRPQMKQPAVRSEYAVALMEELQGIPVSEVVEAIRGNLKATRRVRLSKDQPEGVEEPDHATRQKAAEFIANQACGAAPTRKPIEAPATDAEGSKPSPGILKGKAGK